MNSNYFIIDENRNMLLLLLILAVITKASICDAETYSDYLNAYPMKCGKECEEYFK